jgi:[NiFe] hydrogenase assembly HybE family chaperone
MTDPQASELAARFEEHFRDIHLRCMKDVPICNEALSVAALGFQPFGDWTLGIVLTPWFMNVVAAPRAGAPKVEDRPGATRTLALPAGAVDFLATDLDGFDRLLFASLFSPMQDFLDHEGALATAQAAMDALMKAPAPAPEVEAPVAPKQPVALDRRAFFRLGRRG